jgi:two-component system cell cycle response regulator
MFIDISKNEGMFDINTKSDVNGCTVIIKDEQTGVFNRSYINERLLGEVNNSITHKLQLSVILTDIDNFKNVNEKYGHAIGDKIIEDFVILISNSIRKNGDWVVRYGGDKFLIVLNNISEENTLKVSEKLRNLIKNTPFKYDDIKIKITATSGIYCIKDEITDIQDILTELDKELYEAKKERKNLKICDVHTKIDDYKLSILNNKIEELRDILNEMCMSSDDKADDIHKLNVSQYLDELIVKFMKNM